MTANIFILTRRYGYKEQEMKFQIGFQVEELNSEEEKLEAVLQKTKGQLATLQVEKA